LTQSDDARTCYEQIKDRLEFHEDLSCRLQIILVEQHPVELLKMSVDDSNTYMCAQLTQANCLSSALAALKETKEKEDTFELTVQGWLSLGRAYLSIHRSNDMFDKEQCKYAFDKVSQRIRFIVVLLVNRISGDRTRCVSMGRLCLFK
jgi:hypothetical protein